jgi:phosphoserine phosphatase
MKQTINYLILSLLLAVVACSEPKQSVSLQGAGWDTFNKTQLEKLLNDYGKNSKGYNPGKPPYAVFDWDNTSVFLDIEEALFVYMLQNLSFGATPELLGEAIRVGVENKVIGETIEGKQIMFEDIATDVIDSYTWLYNNYKGLKGDQSLEEVSKSPHYMAFMSKLRYLYDAIDETFSSDISYPWLTYLFAGMTEADIKTVTIKTVEWQDKQPIETVTWITPAELPGKAGCVSVKWKNGMRLVPEMQELYAQLRSNGFDVWVCSASFIDVIKGIAAYPKFGYNQPEDMIIAMELERDADGRILPVYRRGYVQTQGKGKTENIKRFLVKRYGYGPVFVAGDSEGDQNMMQDFQETKLSLIINRLRSPSSDIGRFSKIATDNYGKDNPRWLLQGRDENKGVFIATQASIPLGTNTEIKLKKE